MASTPVRDEDIQRVVDEIVARFRPRRVILFGSYAYGRPHADSDVDLLVEMDVEGSPLVVAGEIAAAISHPFAMDVIVRTPRDFQQKLAQRDTFVTQVAAHGRIMYEAGNRGMA